MNKTETYLLAAAGTKQLLIRQEELEQVMYKPIFTRLPSEEPLLYGIVCDGRSMVVLLDISEGAFAREEAFGDMCLILQCGGRRLAAAVSEIRPLEKLPEESEQPLKSVAELFLQFDGIGQNKQTEDNE